MLRVGCEVIGGGGMGARHRACSIGERAGITGGVSLDEDSPLGEAGGEYEKWHGLGLLRHGDVAGDDFKCGGFGGSFGDEESWHDGGGIGDSLLFEDGDFSNGGNGACLHGGPGDNGVEGPDVEFSDGGVSTKGAGRLLRRGTGGVIAIFWTVAALFLGGCGE